MGDDLAQLDATAQAELVRNGDATPTELVTGRRSPASKRCNRS